MQSYASNGPDDIPKDITDTKTHETFLNANLKTRKYCVSKISRRKTYHFNHTYFKEHYNILFRMHVASLLKWGEGADMLPPKKT